MPVLTSRCAMVSLLAAVWVGPAPVLCGQRRDVTWRQWISSIEECNAAALAIGLGDTNATLVEVGDYENGSSVGGQLPPGPTRRAPPRPTCLQACWGGFMRAR